MSARAKALIAVGIALMFAGVLYFVAGDALDRVVRDGGFVRFISGKSAAKLGASECGYLPVARRGMTIHSAGILARGRPPHHLTELSATNLHAHCSLQNLWQRKLTINLLQASHLQAAYGDAAAARFPTILSAQPNLEAEDDTQPLLHVDIRETDIDRTDVSWGSTAKEVGELKGVAGRFFPKDHGLDIFGRGGTFQQSGWPALNVDELHFNWSKEKMIVQSAIFSLGAPKNFNVTGEFQFGEHGSMQLHVSAKHSPAEPFVMGYWRGKFDGVMDSETDLKKQFEPDAKVDATGELNFSRARVHDVDVLKKIAVVTRHPRFENPQIDVLHFHYHWSGERLEISNFKAETRGLCRLEGKFSIENENIDGDFKIGAAPDVVDALPGAREKVFTEARGDYLWTTLHLSGPARHPREDLKERLVAAAREHFMKEILAPVVKPAEGLIDLLNSIYK